MNKIIYLKTTAIQNFQSTQPVPHWLLTGFIKSETGQSIERGEGFDSAAPTARTPTPARRTRADNPVSSENISQNDNDGNTKFSINASDNSFATFRKKLANEK